jgi:sporulation protein YlmC with PRC-barrel domain
MIMLGKVKDLEFDPAHMKVTHSIVELEKKAAKDLLGKIDLIRLAKERVSTQLIESFKDAIILKYPTSQLKESIESL